jgi:hypothetical protein
MGPCDACQARPSPPPRFLQASKLQPYKASAMRLLLLQESPSIRAIALSYLVRRKVAMTLPYSVGRVATYLFSHLFSY